VPVFLQERRKSEQHIVVEAERRHGEGVQALFSRVRASMLEVWIS